MASEPQMTIEQALSYAAPPEQVTVAAMQEKLLDDQAWSLFLSPMLGRSIKEKELLCLELEALRNGDVFDPPPQEEHKPMSLVQAHEHVRKAPLASMTIAEMQQEQQDLQAVMYSSTLEMTAINETCEELRQEIQELCDSAIPPRTPFFAGTYRTTCLIPKKKRRLT